MENGSRQFRDSVVAQLMLRVASVALAAITLVIVADVVLRSVFNTPVRGAYDVVTIGLLVMVFFGIATVIDRGAEITVDLIDAVLPAGALRFLALVAALVTVVLVLFLGWSMVAPAVDAWRWGGHSLELGVPEWVRWALAFLGLAGIVWVAILKAVRMANRRDRPGDSVAENEEDGL